jgi:hypothetical protein
MRRRPQSSTQTRGRFANANGPGTSSRTQYMIGVYRDLGPRLQLDASTAFSPTTATGKYHTIGFGASYYF